jgi:hypothetical protein
MGIADLVAFGFEPGAAQVALDAQGGDFQLALEALLLGGGDDSNN